MADLVELAAEGLTTRLIAKEIGRGHFVVAKHLRVMRRPPGVSADALAVAGVVDRAGGELALVSLVVSRSGRSRRG